MNTILRAAGVAAVLLAALAATVPIATAATASRPPQHHDRQFHWYRSDTTTRAPQRHLGRRVVLGLRSMQDLKSLRVDYGFSRVHAIPALHAAEVRVNRAQAHALLARASDDSRIRY